MGRTITQVGHRQVIYGSLHRREPELHAMGQDPPSPRIDEVRTNAHKYADVDPRAAEDGAPSGVRAEAKAEATNRMDGVDDGRSASREKARERTDGRPPWFDAWNGGCLKREKMPHCRQHPACVALTKVLRLSIRVRVAVRIKSNELPFPRPYPGTVKCCELELQSHKLSPNANTDANPNPNPTLHSYPKSDPRITYLCTEARCAHPSRRITSRTS